MNAWFRNIQHRIIAPDASISVQLPQNCWRLGLRPRPRWGSLQRSPMPPSCYGLGWRFGNNSSRGQFCAPLLVTARCFEAGYRPGYRMFDCFEMHICMKHVIYYRLVITLNVSPLKVTNWLHWIALFQVWIFNISQGRGLPRPLPSIVISCFTPMLGGLPPST